MEPLIGSARLFSALEQMGQSTGADFRSPGGPGGSPAEEVIRAFEEAMNPPTSLDAPGAPQATVGPQASAEAMNATPAAGDDALQIQAPTAAGPAEFVPGLQENARFQVEGAARGDSYAVNATGGGRGLESAQPLTPVELYQAQYQVGLLRAHLGVVLKSSQSLGQSLETTLKQSG